MKIALPYLYQGKVSGQGVFEETFATRLRDLGNDVKVFYPSNKELRKIPKIGTVLTMASLREYKDELETFDIIYSTNGTCVSLLDLKTPVVAAFHSTGFTIDQKLSKNEKDISEYDLYVKYKTELESIALVPDKIRSGSIESWGLTGLHTAQKVKDLIAVSNNIKKELIANAKVKAKNIEVIENGIEDFWFQNDECKTCNKISSKWTDKPVVMWIGRTGRDLLDFKIKGVDRILEVMGRLDGKKVHKVVMALVPKEQPWHEKIYGEIFRKRGIEFIPNVPYDHLPHLVRKGNIQLMTSRYEACQLSLLEGMASGLAPVAYNIGVVPEAIENNKNGYVVKNVKEMLTKVNYLVEHPRVTLRIGQAARETAIKKHQISDMMDKYIKVFQRVAKK